MTLKRYCKLIQNIIFFVLVNCVVNSHSLTHPYGPSSQSEAYFNGSYLRLQTTISLKVPTGLSFRTCLGGSLFSQQQNNDSFELIVNREGLTFSATTNGNHFEEKLPGNFLNNRWHTVFLQYNLGNLTIATDEGVMLLASNSYNTDLLTSASLYNEGAAVLIIGKHFIGCIQEGPSIVFNKNIIIPNENIKFIKCPMTDDTCIPKEDHQGIDYCLNEPCLKQGTCINGKTTYTCTCLPHYTGKNCEIDLGDPCEKRPSVCKNNGNCSSTPSGEYYCECPPQFTGKHCETEMVIHPLCQNNPCLNKGTCNVPEGTNKIVCTCRAGFDGHLCEINKDECSSNPCKNKGKCIDGLNNYVCDCNGTGYTGSLCEEDIDECVGNPCTNGGICFNTYGNYLCQCMTGFSGHNCEFNINECLSQPCYNNAVCVDKPGGYECRCRPGFLGDHCEVEMRNDYCLPNSCSPYGECKHGNLGPVCECRPEYPGKYPNCTVDAICVPSPCRNGGICSGHKGSFNCSCPPGFTGSVCEHVDPCKPGTCRNGGTCLSDGYSYRCACKDGWTGVRCEEYLTCDDAPCVHALNCQDYLGGYYCTCEVGWTGFNCNVPSGQCSSSPCQNGATCIYLGDYFSCQCAQGFTGKLCQVNINECASSPCLNSGICIDKINSFHCNCTKDWMGTYCEKPYDACELQPCLNNGTCVSKPNKLDYHCNCSTGFDGKNCEENIDDCEGVQCKQGTVCVDLINGYECRCPPGYGGDNCTLDLDPCARDPCSNNAVCKVDKETHHFTCICPLGYQGKHCDVDIDECKVNKNICNNGICVNSNGSFQCYCQPGYTGETCNLDFDECLSMPCRNNATCLNKINKYECVCPPGYTGKDCSVNIDECASNPCTNGSTCIDGINEYTCVCQPGLTGMNCEINIDDCESSPCKNGAKCIDGLNSYVCNCSDTGFSGVHCEINIDDCVGNPCVNGGECIDLVKDYQCKCYNGYTGSKCEIDINECESNPCQYNGICLERSNTSLYIPGAIKNIELPEIFKGHFDYNNASGYECVCIPGIIGKNCEIDIDECQSSPCLQGKCEDQINSYHCICDDGYEGERCDIDIDECEKYHPCVKGTCIDKKADYYCSCDQNYGGKNCSVELIGCQNSPCKNSGTCKPYLYDEIEHRFNCSCDNGFHGPTCETITTMSLQKGSQITVNTTREEGYDIQFRFKTTLGDGLLALGKGFTYYILELSKGRLNLHSSLLNKWEGVFIGSNLNDSKWQKVFVAINSTHLVLSANDEQTIYPINFNDNYNVSSTSFPVTYIGGIPSNLRKLTHGQPFLVGCTEDVQINGEWVLPEVLNSSKVSFMNVDVGCLREPQCTPNPCKSGGHCTDKWRDFSCSCERPFLGHTCQYNFTAATFGYENITDSLVTVTVADYAKRAVRTIVDISMFIRTRQPRGQIFYLGSSMGIANTLEDTYIAAQLEGGELLVSIQFNGSSESYTVGGVHLDNGYNHLIEVIRNITLVQVKLNGTEYFRKTLPATATLDAQVLILGGQPQLRSIRQAENMAVIAKPEILPSASASATALSSVHFKGIIQDVQISNGTSVMVVEFFPLQAKELNIPQAFGTVSFDKNLVKEGVYSDDLCKNKPCSHDGKCENTWNDYICICSRGFKGKNCTELEFCELEECPEGSTCKNLEDGFECIANASFDATKTPLQYSFTQSANSSKAIVLDKIQITYRTRSWGTLLFVKERNDYFVIFIYHNEILLQWSFGGIVEEKRFRKDNFEGQWLTILFKFKDSTLRGGFLENVVDENPNIESVNFDVGALVNLLMRNVIYIAGSDETTFNYRKAINESDHKNTGYIPSSLLEPTTEVMITNSLEAIDPYNEEVLLYKVDQNKKTDKFKGCLGEIRLGGLLLPFFTSKETNSEKHFNLMTNEKVDIGCKLCYDIDCFNQGFCIDPQETFQCNCTDGYAADDCSIDINECIGNECKNNATCVDLIAKYSCECLPGYEGEHCEEDINECLSNPCKNGGTCTDLVGNFKCECPVDFVGRQCEAPLLITCDNKPCRDGATCLPGANATTGNNFTCVCTEGMLGVLCDTPFCVQHPCENGLCNVSLPIPVCECQKGFDGRFCEINIDECQLPVGGSPCQNGGVCIDGINRYDCNCTGTGYTGLLCEMDIDECNEIEMPCGTGICSNIPGNYKCTCSEPDMCGHYCMLQDVCLTSNPCQNGADCISDCREIADYTCNCSDDFEGKNCSLTKALQAGLDNSGFNILYVVIPIFVIIFIGIGIGMIILVNVARSKRATRGTYSPSAQEFCNPRVELDHVLKPPPEERLI